MALLPTAHLIVKRPSLTGQVLGHPYYLSLRQSSTISPSVPGTNPQLPREIKDHQTYPGAPIDEAKDNTPSGNPPFVFSVGHSAQSANCARKVSHHCASFHSVRDGYASHRRESYRRQITATVVRF
jgi:hypothetical protein